jgi:hypothetical protein
MASQLASRVSLTVTIMKMSRRTALVIGALSIVLTLGTMGVMLYFFLSVATEPYLKSVDFDSRQWKARSLDGDRMWPTRLRMVDSLLESGKLDKATRAYVEDLLGPADDTGYFRDWDLVYHLGPERSVFRIDSEWLVVRLDRNSVVQEARLARD